MIYLITDFVDVLLIMPLLSEKENIGIIKKWGGCVIDLRLRTVHVRTFTGAMTMDYHGAEPFWHSISCSSVPKQA